MTDQLTVNEALQYAHDVADGKIDVCVWVRLAVQRHFKNLQNELLHFDDTAAQHVLEFFSFLKHSKGQWAGESFRLEPWQGFILVQIFGWKWRATGLRCYRTAYIEVPRKNGKSTLLAGIALYMMFADGEPGAEVYAAATKRDQAKIVFEEAKRMVQASPALRKRIGVYKTNMHVDASHSKFEPLGADADSLDGLNPHAAVVDELHAHKDRDVWDVLETATGARTQSLLYAITTAGFNRYGICYEQRTYTTKILDGILDDDSYFGIIYTIDKDVDDWRTPAAWRKANPNYGVSVLEDDISRLALKAAEMPSATNNFLTKRLNVWTSQQTLWMSADKWALCGGTVPLRELRGAPCYLGLDLSSTTDITAVVAAFPLEGDMVVLHPRFYLPEGAVDERVRRDKVPYRVWADQGLITLTPGDVIDYRFIRADINAFADTHEVREIAFDRWGATGFATDLQDDGFEVVPFGQGYGSMSPPTKEMERLVLSKKVMHGDNPVLTWMVSNVAIMTDPAGNIKPAKDKSTEKIDGVVAGIMALGRIMVHRTAGPSVYESRGVFTL